MSGRAVLGISCDFHDAAAAVVVDGEVVAAAEEERFSRRKHDPTFPSRAIASCLAVAGVGPDDLDAVVLHEKPLRVVGRVLSSRQRRGARGLPGFVRDMPVLVRRNAMVAYRVERELTRLGARRPPRLRYAEHHLSHACAAFFPSPFETAAILTVDGVGEWSTATIGHGLRTRVDQLVEQRYPHSLGLLYSLATAWCGFAPNDGEYKLMGLAPYGEPTFRDELASVITVGDDGALTVDLRLVPGWDIRPDRLTRVADLLGPPRDPRAPLSQRDADLARSAQDLAEEALLRMADHAHRLTGESALCLAGGVALNCVGTGRILREGPFDQVWVQPAAGDAGSAIGAALWHVHQDPAHPVPRPQTSAPPLNAEIGGLRHDAMRGCGLGPSFSPEEIVAWLVSSGVEHRRVEDRDALVAEVAGRIAEGAVVGWFEGPMEFGPRALGRRSLLADPRVATAQRDLNLRVKGRESFRPFAPAVLWEHASEWFDIDRPSPHMSFTFPVAATRRVAVPVEPTSIEERVAAPRSEIPACTHVDGSARVQTVHREITPLFHALVSAFHRITGCPVLVNTSFNRAGEPIVATPEDAVRTARHGGIDLLVLEDVLVERRALAAPVAAPREASR